MSKAPPYRWHEGRAVAFTPLLQRLVQTMLGWRPK